MTRPGKFISLFDTEAEVVKLFLGNFRQKERFDKSSQAGRTIIWCFTRFEISLSRCCASGSPRALGSDQKEVSDRRRLERKKC
jgi:hypothetical protein